MPQALIRLFDVIHSLYSQPDADKCFGLAPVSCCVWARRKQNLHASHPVTTRNVKKSQASNRGQNETKNFSWNTNAFLFFLFVCICKPTIEVVLCTIQS